MNKEELEEKIKEMKGKYMLGLGDTSYTIETEFVGMLGKHIILKGSPREFFVINPDKVIDIYYLPDENFIGIFVVEEVAIMKSNYTVQEIIDNWAI